jgi:hypothetical protein
VLSTRAESMRILARSLGCALPRGKISLTDPAVDALSEALFARMAKQQPLILYTRYPENDLRIDRPGSSVYLPALPDYANSSSVAARLQGAAVALAPQLTAGADFNTWGEQLRQISFSGMELRPWGYPG